MYCSVLGSFYYFFHFIQKFFFLFLLLTKSRHSHDKKTSQMIRKLCKTLLSLPLHLLENKESVYTKKKHTHVHLYLHTRTADKMLLQ